MKRFLTVALMGVLALGLTSTVYANLCSTDVVPAATLLFPFVQYDYEVENNTTLLAITNVSSEAQIVHITVWTDYSVAILDFNVILTGYDVVTMNIRDILRDGKLPGWTDGTPEYNRDTIWEENNGGPTRTPWDDGPVSDFNELGNYDFGVNNLPYPESTWDGVVVGPPLEYLDCDPDFWISSPNNYDQLIGNAFLDTLEGYLKASQTADKWYEDCSSAPVTITNPDTLEEPWFIMRDSGPVWMYVTADVVNTCNKLLPDVDLAYWATVQTDNVLMGDVIWLDSANGFSETDNAVHLEADISLASTPVGGISGPPTTFYYRYNLAEPSDFREPMPTAWAFRYMWTNPDAGPTQANTWIRAFKAGTESAIVEDLNDGEIDDPGPAELYASACIPYTYYAWDEAENVNSVDSEENPWSGDTDEPVPVPNLLPLETQQVNIKQFFIVGDDEGAFGWMLFVWPRSNTDALVSGVDPAGYDQYQTWMGTQIKAFGAFSAGKSGAVMANWNCDSNEILPQLGLDKY